MATSTLDAARYPAGFRESDPVQQQQIEAICREVASKPDFALRLSYGQKAPATPDDAQSILVDLLWREPSIFLERYGRFLDEKDLAYFDRFKNDYEVMFYLQKLRSQQNKAFANNSQLPIAQSAVDATPITSTRTHDEAVIRNRRYKTMQKMLSERHEYFDLENMQWRYPELYMEYIGKFEEADAGGPPMERFDPDMTLSERLMRNVDIQRTRERMAQATGRAAAAAAPQQQRRSRRSQRIPDPDGIVEYDDSSNEEDEDEESENEEDEEGGVPAVAATARMDTEIEEITEEERDLLREEFVSLVHMKFLNGEDREYFDYAACDTDERLDDLDQMQKDAEDAYFDAANNDTATNTSTAAAAAAASLSWRERILARERNSKVTQTIAATTTATTTTTTMAATTTSVAPMEAEGEEEEELEDWEKDDILHATL